MGLYVWDMSMCWMWNSLGCGASMSWLFVCLLTDMKHASRPGRLAVESMEFSCLHFPVLGFLQAHVTTPRFLPGCWGSALMLAKELLQLGRLPWENRRHFIESVIPRLMESSTLGLCICMHAYLSLFLSTHHMRSSPYYLNQK